MPNITFLENIKKIIEMMSKYHQIEILKILVNNECKLNENKSGVFINLTFLNETVIEEVQKYIQYIQEQEQTLNTTENIKEEYKTEYIKEEYKTLV